MSRWAEHHRPPARRELPLWQAVVILALLLSAAILAVRQVDRLLMPEPTPEAVATLGLPPTGGEWPVYLPAAEAPAWPIPTPTTGCLTVGTVYDALVDAGLVRRSDLAVVIDDGEAINAGLPAVPAECLPYLIYRPASARQSRGAIYACQTWGGVAQLAADLGAAPVYVYGCQAWLLTVPRAVDLATADLYGNVMREAVCP